MIKKQRLIKLTQKVLSYNSENPPGNEKQLGEFIAGEMKSLGLDVRVKSFAKDRPNIIATLKGSWPRKKAAAEGVLITPHYDTVPIGQGWKYDPYGKDIVKGKIYGRGTSDDKGNLAVCMEVMRSFVEDKVRPQRDIIMAATADEETGSYYGIIPLLDKKILQPKIAVITDSYEFEAVVAQKGLVHARVRIQGKKAHGAYNWLGDNAIETAARVIARLQKHRFKVRKHKYLHPPTINIGTIKGGDKVNMVADFCEFSVDTRYLPGMDGKKVIKTLKSIIEKETKNYKFIIDDHQRPYEIDPRHPMVKTYLETAKGMKVKAGLVGSEGATVITFFQKHKIPAFSTGYGTDGTAHSTDEYAEVEKLYKGARLLERYLKDYDEGCES